MNHSIPDRAVVPTSVLCATDISDAAKVLYCELSVLCRERGFCSQSNKEIGIILGCDARTVSRRINELASKGYISSMIEGSREKDGNKERIVRVKL